MKNLLFGMMFVALPALASGPVHQYGSWLVVESDQSIRAISDSTDQPGRFIVLDCGLDHKNCSVLFTDPNGCNADAENTVALIADKHYFGIKTTCTSFNDGWKADASQLYGGQVFDALKNTTSSLKVDFGYGIIADYNTVNLTKVINILEGQQNNFSF
ncbi:hypothetical protein [Parashewanella tropica]|uniref:hypothetical protein n=1 Tax=Parashewanella tropica TaxID=2547970 RepID=UPI001059E8E5|nr:hypothetical protein [Parashewanella tropica]